MWSVNDGEEAGLSRPTSIRRYIFKINPAVYDILLNSPGGGRVVPADESKDWRVNDRETAGLSRPASIRTVI